LGTGECSARCLGGRLGARGAGVRIGSRPWPAGLGWRAWPRRAEGPLSHQWESVLVPASGATSALDQGRGSCLAAPPWI
jgi:hypothetical protein